MKRKLIPLIFMLLISSTISAYQADIEDISSEKYFEATLQSINEAKSSIFLVMYLISISPDQPDSQPSKLLNALIQAKGRGVEVKVILDQNIDFESESTDEVLSNKNQKAFELLKKNNIPAVFDTSNIYTHAKTLIIDNKTVIFGSTNWSKAALTRNNEVNARVYSKEFAQSILSDLNKIQLQENIPASLTPIVPIPKDFLSNKKLMGEMASKSDERSFDTYLYLLKEFNGNSEGVLVLDYDNLAKAINISHMSTEDYRRQINKVLDKLQNKYNLIKFQTPKRNQNTEIHLQNSTSQENINIPTTYWRYNWNNTLSFPAKVMYLINLSHSESSHSGQFSISRETLSKTYGLSESFISQGNQELRKLNLLDIQYSELEDLKFNQRQPNTYALQDLYNPEDLKKDLNKLEQKHSKEKLDRAMKTASLLNFHYLMDTNPTMSYHEGYTGGLYETPWQTPNAGKTAASGRPLVET
ncbi:MAG: hypothetical protein HYZ44_18205, partial [Bacteroidetes bacterium]|nr:hypothetical protein [Bacteroidota bacterium]